MNKIKITAVSYLNTLPFLYGIKNYKGLDNFIFEQKIPSDCAKQLIDKKTDIALMPVVAIPKLESPKIVSEYCIGAVGKVHTVLLVSEVPLNEIEAILLDYQSRSSVNLIKVLANKHWNISPKWINANPGFEDKIGGKNAGVVIGDRAFALHNKFKYVFDLAEEWKKMTNLPFVFAAWVANSEIASEFLSKFNEALEFGLNNIEAAIQKYHTNLDSQIDLNTYLTKNIDFRLDKSKLESLKLFFNYLIELNLLEKNALRFLDI